MKEARSRIVLLLSSIFFSIVIIEILLAFLNKPCFYKSHSAPAQFAFVSLGNNDIVYFSLPSQRIRFIYGRNPRGYFDKDNAVDHVTNSSGFRGKEFLIQKPKNTFRMVFLGDSFTFGEGVKFEGTYPEVISSLLGQKYSSLPVNFESYNFGVGGYNTTQSLYVLRNIAMKVNPDIVVLGYTLNDAEPQLFYRDAKTGMVARRPREHYVPEGIGNSIPPDNLLYNLRISRLLWQLCENRSRTRETFKYYNSLFLETSSGWIESRNALHEFISLCREQNIPCYILLFPVLYQLNDRYPFWHIHSLIQKEAQSKNAFFIDLLLYLKGLDEKGLWVYPNDQHPNEKVHAIAAGALAEKIASNPDIDAKIRNITR
ncbi:MAG: SGNH/GDSL hydrolase family protein [Candidatus Omnitrophota bacterium]